MKPVVVLAELGSAGEASGAGPLDSTESSPTSAWGERVRLDAVNVRTGAGLRALSPVFSKMYAAGDRPSFAPERLLKPQLYFTGHARSERRNGLMIDFAVADERAVALHSVHRRRFQHPKILSDDKGRCTRGFIAAPRNRLPLISMIRLQPSPTRADRVNE